MLRVDAAGHMSPDFLPGYVNASGLPAWLETVTVAEQPFEQGVTAWHAGGMRRPGPGTASCPPRHQPQSIPLPFPPFCPFALQCATAPTSATSRGRSSTRPSPALRPTRQTATPLAATRSSRRGASWRGGAPTLATWASLSRTMTQTASSPSGAFAGAAAAASTALPCRCRCCMRSVALIGAAALSRVQARSAGVSERPGLHADERVHPHHVSAGCMTAQQHCTACCRSFSLSPSLNPPPPLCFPHAATWAPRRR